MSFSARMGDYFERIDRDKFYAPKSGAGSYVHSRLSEPHGSDISYGLDTVCDEDSARLINELFALCKGHSEEDIASHAEFVSRAAEALKRYADHPGEDDIATADSSLAE